VRTAIELQKSRYAGFDFFDNGRIPVGLMDTFCPLDAECRDTLHRASRTMSISSRAVHSVMRVARTIADLSGAEAIRPEHVREAIQHRRYGDGDFYWIRARV
jgi:magnesium chelatase family protein